MQIIFLSFKLISFNAISLLTTIFDELNLYKYANLLKA